MDCWRGQRSVRPDVLDDCAAGGGFIAPNIVLTRLVARRREKIRRSIPEAIDLLVICVGSGLGIDQHCCRRAGAGDQPSADHRGAAADQPRTARGQAARRGWADMAARSELEDIDAFAAMLQQTERLGRRLPGAEHVCRHHPNEAAAACGGAGGEDDSEDHLSAGAVYLSEHVYCCCWGAV